MNALASRLRLSVIRLARQIRRRGDDGLSPTLISALFVVEVHGPITPGNLAEHEGIRRPTCTRTIAALEEQGLVQRTPDPLDGRMAWLSVTPTGRKVVARTRRQGNELIARGIRSLQPEDLATLERAAEILDRIAEEER